MRRLDELIKLKNDIENAYQKKRNALNDMYTKLFNELREMEAELHKNYINGITLITHAITKESTKDISNTTSNNNNNINNDSNIKRNQSNPAIISNNDNKSNNDNSVSNNNASNIIDLTDNISSNNNMDIKNDDISAPIHARKKQKLDHNYYDKPWECNACSQTFKTNKEMTTHMNTSHIGSQKFKCDRPFCAKEFSSKVALSIHVISEHL